MDIVVPMQNSSYMADYLAGHYYVAVATQVVSSFPFCCIALGCLPPATLLYHISTITPPPLTTGTSYPITPWP